MLKKLPVGRQDFKSIIDDNYLYIDKTELIYKLINSGAYYFLSRPRRFGKSLLLSTLKQIFLGNKDLFKSLYIENVDYHWKKYPVIYLDFSAGMYRTLEEFNESLKFSFSQIALKYNIDLSSAINISQQIVILITELSKIEKVVILIDEYDRPLLDNILNLEIAKMQQEALRGFYLAIKSLDKHIQFLFMTGVSRFSKTSVFSGLNNLNDITYSQEYSTLVGYTENEINKYFDDYFERISQKENENIIDLKKEIQNWYNGYQFSANPIRVYNSFSVLSYLNSGELHNYWFASGTPKFLVDLINEKKYSIESFENVEVNIDSLGNFDIDDLQPIPLLLQTGYLTIKSYNKDTKNYLLTYPNTETKNAFLLYFFNRLTDHYQHKITSVAFNLRKHLLNNEIDKFFDALKIFMSSIPSDIHISKEKYYHSIFYIVLSLSGIEVLSENGTNIGRIDAVMQTAKDIYIIEFKLNKSAQVALQQIKDKKYYEKFLNLQKNIYLIGVEFNTDERNIKEYIVEKYQY